MKAKLRLIIFLGLSLRGAALAAAPATGVDSPVTVTFVAPETYTDVKNDYMESELGRDSLLAQLKRHIIRQATQYLGTGQRLEITVTNVDLAGDFEPWLGFDFQDIRIVKDVYPPRMDLGFRLLDGSGQVVSEGRRQLRELGYMLTLTMPSTDPLRHDKAMIDHWLRREFKHPLGAGSPGVVPGREAALFF